jgi:general secretion pathway protein C
MKHLPTLTSFALFVALCASTAYWAMQIIKPAQRPVSAPPVATQSLPKLSSAAGLMGGRSSIVVSSNYQLKGVVVDSDPAESVAILVVNGKNSQAVKAKSEISPGVAIMEVHRQFVLLSEQGTLKRIELPANPPHH